MNEREIAQETTELKEKLERFSLLLTELEDWFAEIEKKLPACKRQVQNLKFRVAISRELM